jgi:hypothetical protein
MPAKAGRVPSHRLSEGWEANWPLAAGYWPEKTETEDSSSKLE